MGHHHWLCCFQREPEKQHMVHRLLVAPHPYSVLFTMTVSGVFSLDSDLTECNS